MMNALAGLKLLMVCFEKQLATHWYRIYKCILDLGMKLQGKYVFLPFYFIVSGVIYCMQAPTRIQT